MTNQEGNPYPPMISSLAWAAVSDTFVTVVNPRNWEK